MRLTPLDIRKQEFSRGFRGFDAEEVNAFLQMVANQWEELQDENRRREEKIRELENKLVHYEKVEEALQEALQTARESARKALQNAEDKAEMIVLKAESRAEDIKREAEQERHDLKRETVKLSGRRSEIVTRLRAFLMSEMELLARYEGDDPVGFIKLLPADENRLRKLPERPDDENNERASADAEAGDDDLDLSDEERPWQDPVDRDDTLGIAETHSSQSAEDAGAELRSEPTGHTPSQAAQSDSEWAPRQHGESAAREGQTENADQPKGGDIKEGPGWTTQTVVSRPSELQGGAHGRRQDDDDSPRDGEATAESSDEIEKIRRILSDLD